MAALPYIQLYVADYLADTMHLTTEQHGAYLLLILNYWQTGKAIPESRLAPIARLSNDRWKSVEDVLSEFFTKNEDGCWYHERIEQDLEKVRSKSTQASAAGKASAAKRAAINKAQATEKKGNSNGRSKSVEQKPNHTDTDTNTETKDQNPAEKQRKKLSDLIYPMWLNVIAWDEFIEHRKTIRKPLSFVSAVKNIKVLEQHKDHQQEIIDATIANNWTGLFPPKERVMEHASKIATAVQSELITNSKKSHDETLKKTDLPKHWVAKIFQRLQARYLHKWSSAIDGIEEVAVDEWAKGLSGLTGEQIKRGMDEWTSDWPPTLDEFKACCLGKNLGTNEFGLNYTPEVYRQQSVRERSRLLSSDERDANRKQASNHVAEMRETLRGGHSSETTSTSGEG